MLKNMKLGLKMALGFGLVIALLLVVGGLAGLNMLQIQADSVELEEKYIPEVVIAVDVQAQALETMYAMRGYSMSFDQAYYADATRHLTATLEAIDDALVLARTQDLAGLESAGREAYDAAVAYRSLAQETDATVERVLAARATADAAGDRYVAAFDAFLASMEQQFLAEIHAGQDAAALEERLFKITRGNEALDLGNGVRLANLRAQATNDASMISAALPDFDRIDEGLNDILAVTRLDSDRHDLAAISSAADNYRAAMQEIQRSMLDLEELGERREAAGYAVLSEAAEIVGLGTSNATDISTAAVEQVGTALTAIVIAIVVALTIAVVVAILLTRGITVPVGKGVRFAQQIALGELDIELDVEQSDEIGMLAVALRGMLESLQYKAKLVERISKGDLTVEVEVASAKDGLGNSLVRMIDSLNEILGQVQVAIEQVAAGAGQVSSASQDLSQGATESASSLEEITSSINEISSQSRQNRDSSSEANGLSRQAAADAQAGQQQMSELRTAMGSISEASNEITKVVKVIDDIAFQINLLALNANVEAARAGKYGKGFAVVAEEVRNLAVRSAEAVKETTAMVDQSVGSIETGNQLTEKTAERLEGIVGGAAKVAQFLEEIAAASKEQSLAIEQITEGLGQVDQVTQSNTASAEESASASEELSSQAEQLRSSIAVFKLKSASGNGAVVSGGSAASGRQVEDARRHITATAKTAVLATATSNGGHDGNGGHAERAIELDDDFDRF